MFKKTTIKIVLKLGLFLHIEKKLYCWDNNKLNSLTNYPYHPLTLGAHMEMCLIYWHPKNLFPLRRRLIFVSEFTHFELMCFMQRGSSEAGRVHVTYLSNYAV